MTNYYLGQGKLYIGRRGVNGRPGPIRWLGDVGNAKIQLKTQSVPLTENFSGQRLTVKNVILGKDGSFDFTLMEWSRENLALGLYGSSRQIDASSVSGEVLPAGLLAGDRIGLRYPGVSNVIVTDSATPPVAVSADACEVDERFGAITILNPGAYVQPFVVAYQHGAVENVAMFTQTANELFVRFEGLNLAEEGQPVVVELYRMQTEPLKELSLINDKAGELQISGKLLADTDRPTDADVGQFGRIIRVA